MKKIFLFFLALMFLTSCNLTPPAGTLANDSLDNTQESNPNKESENVISILKSNYSMINLPSRIIFEDTVAGLTRTYYYSKVDGNAYVYCFDPLCDHTDYTCFGNPNAYHSGWNFSSTFFINNRFYSVTAYGQIWSFAVDGSDKRIEYDAGYELTDTVITNIWSTPPLIYGQYIYIILKADETGNPHNLRYNIETKEMEDLTNKTGNFISPQYVYNGIIYGMGDARKMGDTYLKADLDLNTVEINENFTSANYAVNNLIVGKVWESRESIFELPKLLGIKIFDVKTEKYIQITNAELGVESVEIAGMTNQYIYFYDNKIVNLGTMIVNIGGKDKEMPVQKMNNGKLYRMNLDGTNIICVYDNSDYELSSNMAIYDDKIVMQGQYVSFENNTKKIWGGAIQVATINPDGTLGEFVEVEILQ